jgi:hypothetical protein
MDICIRFITSEPVGLQFPFNIASVGFLFVNSSLSFFLFFLSGTAIVVRLDCHKVINL